MAGKELVAGVYYNDENHDVEVGSDRDLSDGGWDIHGSEVEDIAFIREVRAVRRNNAKACEGLGISGMHTDSSLWRNTCLTLYGL